MQKKPFTELGLSPEILKAVGRVGYEEASPIQSEAIPHLLTGADLVGQSQTGSGKTAAFAIPAIERVDPSITAPQVLILCPTRELAVQVAEEVAKLAFYKRGLRELPIYGGQSYERQFRGLQQGAQIIIGTPGRVIDHLQRGSLRLDHLRSVILDEADRMLDMGFVEDIREILSRAPEERQTVFFSATLPKPIKDLINTFTHDPVHVRIETPTLTVPAIDQVYYEVERRSKVEVLCRLIDLQDIRFGIIFCATKMMADELTEQLTARGYAADKLHGDITQAGRERVMNRFRKHAIDFLVATDVAARGVDVDGIEAVFNYDLPQDGEDYVHRIGRTGRAGKAGRAITLVSGREIWKLQQIIRFTKGRIQRERVPSLEEVEEKRANLFFESLRTTLEKGAYKKYDHLIDRLLDQGHNPTDISSALIHLAGGDKMNRPAGNPPANAPQNEPFYDDQPARPRREPRDFREPREPREFREPRDREPREPREAREFREPRAPKEFHDFPPRRQEAARPPTRREAPESFSKEKPWKKEKPVRRKSKSQMTELVFNTGREHEVGPGDIVGVIAGAAKVDRESVGSIRLLAKKSLVEVEPSVAARIMEKLNGITFKGHQLRVEPGDA